MFKSKSSSENKSAAFPSVLANGSEERTPEPKLRWRPRPEQIQHLEDIFNSGMVKPPGEVISKIRAQLQEYGQVEDANVFYWFQNRRTRSKQKNHQQNSATKSTSRRPLLAPSSSSSSSDRSLSNGVQRGGFPELSKNSSSGLMNQNSTSNNQYNQYPNQNLQQNQVQAPPPYYYQNQQTGAIVTGVFGSGTGAGGSSSQMESFSGTLHGEQMMVGRSFMNTNPINTTQAINVLPPPAFNFQIPATSQVQAVGGEGMVGLPRSTATVLINGVEFQVSTLNPFVVQETFGKDAVLFYQSGHPVPTNDWGATIHPLKHGASYILKSLRPSAAPNQFPFN